MNRFDLAGVRSGIARTAARLRAESARVLSLARSRAGRNSISRTVIGVAIVTVVSIVGLLSTRLGSFRSWRGQPPFRCEAKSPFRIPKISHHARLGPRKSVGSPLIPRRSRTPRNSEGRFRGMNRVAILWLFLGVVAWLVPLNSAEIPDDDGSRRLSVQFHHGGQEREIEARIDYFRENDPEGIYWSYERTTVTGPFTRYDSMDKLEFKRGDPRSVFSNVYFNGTELELHGKKIWINAGVLASSHPAFYVCFSKAEQHLEVWVDTVSSGTGGTFVSTYRFYFDRKLKKIVMESDPIYFFQGPFCADHESVESERSLALHLEKLFALGANCHDKNIVANGYSLAQVEDRILTDIVNNVNQSQEIDVSNRRLSHQSHRYGMGQYEFLEMYLTENLHPSAERPYPLGQEQLVLVRRSDSEFWYCVARSSESHTRFGYTATGIGWVNRLEIADGNILQIWTTSSYGRLGDESRAIRKIDLNNFRLLTEER